MPATDGLSVKAVAGQEGLAPCLCISGHPTARIRAGVVAACPKAGEACSASEALSRSDPGDLATFRLSLAESKTSFLSLAEQVRDVEAAPVHG